MSIRMFCLATVLTLFSLLTTVALVDVGYLGIIEPHFQSWGAAQVFADLVIIALLACVWMVNDARARGLHAWPFVVLTLVAGSFGPLVYLLWRERRQATAQGTHAATR